MDKKGTEFLVTTFVSKESILKGRQGDEMTIQDDFNLSDLVVKPEIRDSHGASKPSPFQLIYKRPNGVLRIRYKGTAINIPVIPTKAAELSMHMKEKPKLDTSKVVLSPMPGVVKSIAVEVGQLVGEGLECCVVEAMKMQNSMKAAITSKVKSINVKPGDTVEEDQILVELE
jgi:propionyl-CoA carboxylase alpha chain